MESINTILWDVDQTLLDFKRSEEYALRYCFGVFGLEMADGTAELYAAVNDSFWKKIETGEMAKEDALVGRFEALFGKIGAPGVDAGAFHREYVEALGSVYYFLDDSYELVKRLGNSCRQYIVSNGVTRTLEKKLALSGLDRLVDGVFVSEQLGVPKPQAEFFERCFAQIPHLEKERTVIIGDSLSSDILGGERAGIRTCWYNPQGVQKYLDVRVDYEIRNLNEVVPLLFPRSYGKK